MDEWFFQSLGFFKCSIENLQLVIVKTLNFVTFKEFLTHPRIRHTSCGCHDAIYEDKPGGVRQTNNLMPLMCLASGCLPPISLVVIVVVLGIKHHATIDHAYLPQQGLPRQTHKGAASLGSISPMKAVTFTAAKARKTIDFANNNYLAHELLFV
jgi:hypothetical protein